MLSVVAALRGSRFFLEEADSVAKPIGPNAITALRYNAVTRLGMARQA